MTQTRSDDRPWPVPDRRWALSMKWHDLLFMHWPVPPEVLRPHVPPALAIDTYDGAAWIGIVPFVMRRVRPRWLPAVPWLSNFPELNVRTYVRERGKSGPEGKPGVWFFSLDAHQPVAVRLARWSFRLPYFDAQMEAAPAGDGALRYASRRTHRGAPPAAFRARYRPAGPPEQAEAGTLTRWLTERYCLYAARAGGENADAADATVYRGEIDHRPWPLQPAEVDVEENTLCDALPFALPDRAPHLRFSKALDVRAWAPRALG